ncbi:MAG: mechanosensitive ion channel [Eubacteriales bacterium]
MEQLLQFIGLQEVIDSTQNMVLQSILALGMKVIVAIIVILVGMQVIKVIRKILHNALKKSDADQGVIQFLDSLIKVLLYVVLFLTIASNFGVEAASIIAILGSAGVAIGLALQGSLSNFAGGVLILLLKPFVVGDYIIEDNKGNEGTVSEIELFYTRLRTPDDRIVILPNGILANTSLTNLTTTKTRRLDIKVGISYTANIQEAKAVLAQMIEGETRIIKDMERNVYVDELGDSAVVIGVRGFVANEDYWAVRWTLMEQVKECLDKKGIEIPYPQIDVHMNHSNFGKETF